ncbi:MAG: eL32 family ribosomal protein [Candidatus Woesearchaeota archaeon]
MAKNNQKTNELVQIKQRLKKFKFVRPNAHKLKKLDEAWRRPKRKSSLARVQIKGKPRLVKVGYRTPKDLRNKTLDGKNIVRVVRIEDFKGLDPKKDAIIIARVSKKNKIELLQYCIDHKFEVLNHDPEESIKRYKSQFEKKSNENKEKRNAKKAKFEEKSEENKQENKEEKVEEANKEDAEKESSNSSIKETKKSKKKEE